MVETGCGRWGPEAKGNTNFSSRMEVDVPANELIEEDVVVRIGLLEEDCTGVIMVEELRLLLTTDPKRGTEVVEVRYANPLSVLTIQEDEDRVSRVEPLVERGWLCAVGGPWFSAMVPSSD